MNAKLAALLAKLDDRFINTSQDDVIMVNGAEYDLLREALREREGEWMANCLHDWRLGNCVHCAMSESEFRARVTAK